jgi:ABC-type branched-subunit amino acid transport system substrate-binding protein
MPKKLSLLTVLVCALGTVTVSSAGAAPAAARSDSTEVVIARGQPVEIAFADDLTGSASAFGPSLANAVQMAVEAHPSVRGFPVRINLVDAPCADPAADVAAAASIVANAQNVGVLGQLCSIGFEQALPVYESADVVTISGSATSPSLPPFGPNVFNSVAVPDGCCPVVDEFGPWYATVGTLPSDLAWKQAYTERFGAAPSEFADLYYDAAGLLIRRLHRVSAVDGSGDLLIDRTALARAVRSTTRYQGVTCRVALDPATGYRIDEPTALSRCAG